MAAERQEKGGSQQQVKPNLIEKGFFPEIVLLKIFSNLSIHDLGRVSLVCKQWNSVIRSDVVWKRFVPKWPWFEPPPDAEGAYQTVRKLWKKKCVRIGNERWLPNPMPELVKYEKRLRKAEFHNYFTRCSSMTLMARLNPCYEFTTKGKDSEDPKMNGVCEEIWNNFGRKDEPRPLEVKSHKDVMERSEFRSRKEAMTKILEMLEPWWYLEALEFPSHTLDEEGEIVNDGNEKQMEGSVPEEPEEDIPDEMEVSRFVSIFGSYLDKTAWKTRINKRLPVELYKKIKAFFSDGSEHFIEYLLSDGCFNENFAYGHSLLISDKAVFHIIEFYEL